MKKSNLLQLCVVLALVFIAGTMIGPAASNPSTADWRTTLQQRLPLYGHRNWIVVSDAAFPAYSQNGIETIVVNQDLPSVLNYVAKAISSSKHLREEINRAFGKSSLPSIPHAEALSKIDDAGKIFRVLFIKTNTTIPYSSVFLRLDCGYMTDEIESKIRNAIAAANK